MNDTFTMFVIVRRETPKALLVERLDGGRLEQHWVPRSQIRDSEVCYRGERGNIEVTRWWAEKAGILDGDDDGGSSHSPAPAVIELTQATRIYRQLAQQHHPDRVGGDGKTMKAINVLWDAVKNDVVESDKQPMILPDIETVAVADIPALLARLAGLQTTLAVRLMTASAPAPSAARDDLLDAKQVAAKLNVPPSWVAEQGRLGNIPVVKLGRYSRYRLAEVAAALNQRNGNPA